MANEPNTLSLAPDDMPRGDVSRLMLSIIAPRPIAWISTLGADGAPNLAPYSFFNGVSGFPPTVMFSVSPRRGASAKDTLRNVEETGEFVVNMVSESLAEAMNVTAGEWPYDVDEFEKADLETAPSIEVKPPRVAAAPVAMEARVTQLVPVDGSGNTMVLGRVLHFHIREDLLLPSGLVDPNILRPVARLGGDEYATLGNVFSMLRPRVDEERKTR